MTGNYCALAPAARPVDKSRPRPRRLKADRRLQRKSFGKRNLSQANLANTAAAAAAGTTVAVVTPMMAMAMALAVQPQDGAAFLKATRLSLKLDDFRKRREQQKAVQTTAAAAAVLVVLLAKRRRRQLHRLLNLKLRLQSCSTGCSSKRFSCNQRWAAARWEILAETRQHDSKYNYFAIKEARHPPLTVYE